MNKKVLHFDMKRLTVFCFQCEEQCAMPNHVVRDINGKIHYYIPCGQWGPQPITKEQIKEQIYGTWCRD